MDNKKIVLNVINGLKVKSISNKEINIFFNHLNLTKEEIRQSILELIKDGELISTKNKLFLPKNIGYVKGEIVANEKGFAFLKTGEQEDYFIAPQNVGSAINGDTVLAKIVFDKRGRGDGQRKEAKVEKIIKHKIQNIVGLFKKNGNIAYVEPIDKKINRDIFISGNSKANAKIGQLVNVKITDYKEMGMSLDGEIIEILGYPNDKGVDIVAVARKYNLTEKFPDEVLKETDYIPDVVDVSKYSKRKMFKDNIITIDGEDTRDIDDAISLIKENGNYRLWVHIADVNEYVKHKSLIDEEAFRRGTSVYFPNFVIPMFPIKLSNGICSLNEGTPRLALTCEMLINKNGKVVESDVYESVIVSKHRMNYNEVQRIIDGDSDERKKYSDVVDMIENMNELGKILYNMREKRGALDFDVNEAYIKVDEFGKTINIERRSRKDSDKIIESFMISANESVAEKFFHLDMPFVYRVHEEPNEIKINRFVKWCLGFGEKFNVREGVKGFDIQNFLKSLESKDYGEILNKLALRTMQKAKYSNINVGHFGLGSECYCHFTSPIRRYPDLTVHRLIKWFLNNDLYTQDLDELNSFVIESANNSSETERNAEEAEREVDDMKKAEYMQQFIGESFNGIVSGVTNFGIFVELENTCEGRVDINSLPGKWTFVEEKQIVCGPKGIFRLGQKVKVKLIRSCSIEKEIDFEFEEFLNEKNNSNKVESSKCEQNFKKTSKNQASITNF